LGYSWDTQCGQSTILDQIPIGYTNNQIWTDNVTVAYESSDKASGKTVQ